MVEVHREARNDRLDVEQELVVVESSQGGFRAEADGLPASRFASEYVDVSLGTPVGPEYRLPSVGETIIVLGGMCSYMTEVGYVRVLGGDRELLWEGGSPGCGEGFSLFDYPWHPNLGDRVRVEPEPCFERLFNRDGEWCCCDTRIDRDVILHADGDSILVPGEDRLVEIDGAQFLASALGSFELLEASCTHDRSGVEGSAFIVRLAEQ